MPARYFICSSNKEVEIVKCLEHCDNPQGRCLSLPVLSAIGWQRPFEKPSTTQLLKGLRQSYLEIVCNYSINPMESAFALLGTRIHKRLDIIAKKLELISEKDLEDDETKSTLDLLEPDPAKEGYYKLIDMKCWGSYALAKALGIKKHDSDPEISDATWQLNHYRYKVSKIGFPVSQLFILAIVRDGGTYIAKNNGIEQKFCMLPIKILPDIDVINFFQTRASKLMYALQTKQLPDKCSYQEAWGYRKCKGFCNVFAWCPEGAQINKIPLKILDK